MTTVQAVRKIINDLEEIFKSKGPPVVFLASPYSSEDKAECDNRFQQACRITYELMEKGFVVFSPIAMTHHLDRAEGKEHDFWMRQSLEMLMRCDVICVATELEGWRKSEGITQEIAKAHEIGIPVHYGVANLLAAALCTR